MRLRIRINSKGAAGSFTKGKLSVLAMATALMTASAQPFAIGSDGALGSTGSMTALSDAGGAKDNSTTAGDNMSLDNIEDVAFTLQRIRQQAINVYVEATRKKVHRFELNIPSLSSMPTAPLEDQSAYLPLRKAWLAFFIGTMEPLVSILNDHLKHIDERTEKRNIPTQYRPEWNGIVSTWTSAIHDLNAQLDVCSSLLDDPSAGNVEVAKAAKAIDSQVSTLEDILQKASKFLHDKLPASYAGQ